MFDPTLSNALKESEEKLVTNTLQEPYLE